MWNKMYKEKKNVIQVLRILLMCSWSRIKPQTIFISDEEEMFKWGSGPKIAWSSSSTLRTLSFFSFS